MQTDEIVKLTRKRVTELLRQRRAKENLEAFEGDDRRQDTRWPFPGAVELWPIDGDGRQRWFASCGNLSEGGIGLMTDKPFEPGTPVEIACHFEEATFCGLAQIRHCTQTPHGYFVGAQFDFGD